MHFSVFSSTSFDRPINMSLNRRHVPLWRESGVFSIHFKPRERESVTRTNKPRVIRAIHSMDLYNNMDRPWLVASSCIWQELWDIKSYAGLRYKMSHTVLDTSATKFNYGTNQQLPLYLHVCLTLVTYTTMLSFNTDHPYFSLFFIVSTWVRSKTTIPSQQDTFAGHGMRDCHKARQYTH